MRSLKFPGIFILSFGLAGIGLLGWRNFSLQLPVEQNVEAVPQQVIDVTEKVTLEENQGQAPSSISTRTPAAPPLTAQTAFTTSVPAPLHPALATAASFQETPGFLQAGTLRKLPNIALARAQVALNVHATPASLHQFAEEVAAARDLVSSTGLGGSELVHSLALCVEKTNAALSARVYCLAVLRSLAQEASGPIVDAATEAATRVAPLVEP